MGDPAKLCLLLGACAVVFGALVGASAAVAGLRYRRRAIERADEVLRGALFASIRILSAAKRVRREVARSAGASR
jgi:hypothetical protein